MNSMVSMTTDCHQLILLQIYSFGFPLHCDLCLQGEGSTKYALLVCIKFFPAPSALNMFGSPVGKEKGQLPAPQPPPPPPGLRPRSNACLGGGGGRPAPHTQNNACLSAIIQDSERWMPLTFV